MASIAHEIWEDTVEGMVLHTCCFAGPMGEECRQTLGSNARLLTTFEATSHFEAMAFYNRFLGREPYATDEPGDFETYPDEWLRK